MLCFVVNLYTQYLYRQDDSSSYETATDSESDTVCDTQVKLKAR